MPTSTLRSGNCGDVAALSGVSPGQWWRPGLYLPDNKLRQPGRKPNQGIRVATTAGRRQRSFVHNRTASRLPDNRQVGGGTEQLGSVGFGTTVLVV